MSNSYKDLLIIGSFQLFILSPILTASHFTPPKLSHRNGTSAQKTFRLLMILFNICYTATEQLLFL